MAINEIPIGVYTDVTGVVDGTAAAEIVLIFDEMLRFVPDPEATDAPIVGASGEAPDFDNVPPAYSVHIREEIAALRAAIAAAPTS